MSQPENQPLDSSLTQVAQDNSHNSHQSQVEADLDSSQLTSQPNGLLSPVVTGKLPKIIQLSTYFHPSVGGVERQVEEISVYLKQHGYPVKVLTTDATHGKEKRMQRLFEVYNGVQVQRFRYLIRLGSFFRFAPGVVWQLLVADYDILHVHNMHDGHLLAAMLIKLVRRKRLVVTGHNPYVVSDQKRGALLHRLVGVYEVVTRLLAFTIDRYIALLESEKLEVVRRFGIRPDRVAVIPNGIQELFFDSLGDAGRFYTQWQIEPQNWNLIVGTASRLNYVKGIQNLLTAVRQLPDVLFIIAGGDDGYFPTLRKLFNQYPNVIFTESYLSSEELKDFYQAIDLFLLPSVYEPFGMTIIEAFAQGKMVLATSKGGAAEIVPTNLGHVVDPQDQTAWYEQISHYAQNRNLLLENSQLAREYAQKYRWPNVISLLEAEYTKICPAK